MTDQEDASTNLLKVKVSQIEDSTILLRKVDKTHVKYKELRDSIARDGVIEPLIVRPRFLPDGVTPKIIGDSQVFEIVDGKNRLEGCRDTATKEVNVVVKNLSDDEVERIQVVTNSHYIETAPADYAKRLRLFMSKKKTITFPEIAAMVNKSEDWVRDTLALNRLPADLSALVDAGTIPVAAGYALAKLKTGKGDEADHAEMQKFIDLAKTEKVELVVDQIKKRGRELKIAQQKGQVAPENRVFEPKAHFRKREEVTAETESPTAIPALLTSRGLAFNPEQHKATLDWVLNLDPATQAEMKARFQLKMSALAEAKKKSEQERKDRAAQKATQPKKTPTATFV